MPKVCVNKACRSTECYTRAMLLKLAHKAKITGRHAMTKEQLCKRLVRPTNAQKKKKQQPAHQKKQESTSSDDDETLPSSTVTPLQHQKKVIKALLRPDVHGLLIYHGLGSGKTITSVLAAEAYMKRPENSKVRCLVVLSAGVRDQFSAEIKRATSLHSRFDVFSREAFLKRKGKCSKDTVVIIDEAHNLRNPGQGAMTAAVKACASNCAKVMLLSATPLVNGVHEIGNLLSFFKLPSKKRLPTGAVAFASAYGDDGLKKLATLKKEVNCAISYYCNPKKTVDFPRSSKIKRVWVRMSPEQKSIHDAIINKEHRKIAHLLDAGDEKSLSKLMTFLQKPRQVCNRVVDTRGVVHQPKIDSLLERVAIAVRSGKKCVVYSQYIAQGVNPIRAGLDALNIKHVQLTGGMSFAKRRQAVEDYNAGRAKVFILSKAGGEGIDLKETGEVHILEPHFHNSSLEQVFGRAIRYKSHKDPTTEVKRVVYHSIKQGEDRKNMEGHIKEHSSDWCLWKVAKIKSKKIKKFVKQVIIPVSIEKCKL